MRYAFSMEMEDLGRMESRVLVLFERLQAKIVAFHSTRVNDRIAITGIIEIEREHARRLEALSHRIEGVKTVEIWRAEDAANHLSSA